MKLGAESVHLFLTENVKHCKKTMLKFETLLSNFIIGLLSLKNELSLSGLECAVLQSQNSPHCSPSPDSSENPSAPGFGAED
ncbi:hypothetical protein FLGSB24_30210 [Flavobacterium sp. GSB-24]|nr:hypothetical protein FLGSB24_30210 [Flavobacterium sp. GSB-24]